MENNYLKKEVGLYSEINHILSRILIKKETNKSKLVKELVERTDNEAIFALEYFYLTGKSIYSIF